VKHKFKYYRTLWLRHDLPAALTVFLVALPLCLGIALASGAPLYAGLLSGIIGGLVVAVISGSHLGVSGPAAGLTTVVAGAIISLGSFELFLLAVFVAGLMQLAMGLLKLGGFANYFPSAVIKGMLAAIGIMLVLKQIPLAMGYDQPEFWASAFTDMFTSNNVFANVDKLSNHISLGPFLICSFSILILIFSQRPFMKRWKILPAPLLVVVAGIAASFVVASAAPSLALKSTQLVNIPWNVFASISIPDFTQLFSNAGIWKYGLIIGLLATLETLLSVEAVDKLDAHNRITPVNRELVAQGMGNMLCGVLGAIPMTAVIVRGAANADAGARTKLSAFTHGAFLLIAVLLIPSVLSMIPYAALAAILIVTGYNLSRPALYREMWSLGLKQFLPFIITIVVILATDLLIGVSIGLLVSTYFIVQNNLRAEYRLTKTHEGGIDTYYFKLNTNVTFLNKVKLREALDAIPEYCTLTIDGTDARFIDYDVLEIISEYEHRAHDRHIDVHLKGIKRVRLSSLH